MVTHICRENNTFLFERSQSWHFKIFSLVVVLVIKFLYNSLGGKTGKYSNILEGYMALSGLDFRKK